MTKDLKSDRWTCPNDRNLQLRSKLNAGWSIHTGKKAIQKDAQLTENELNEIQKVLQRSQMVEKNERDRVSKLVERLENMKKNASQSIPSPNKCSLCGDYFCLLRSTPNKCAFCHRILCSKCCIDSQYTPDNDISTNGSRRNSITGSLLPTSKVLVWQCRLCSEQREFLKKSGAWFSKKCPTQITNERFNSTSNISNTWKESSFQNIMSSSNNLRRNISSFSSNSLSFRFWNKKDEGDNFSTISMDQTEFHTDFNSNNDNLSLNNRTLSSDNLQLTKNDPAFSKPSEKSNFTNTNSPIQLKRTNCNSPHSPSSPLQRQENFTFNTNSSNYQKSFITGKSIDTNNNDRSPKLSPHLHRKSNKDPNSPKIVHDHENNQNFNYYSNMITNLNTMDDYEQETTKETTLNRSARSSLQKPVPKTSDNEKEQTWSKSSKFTNNPISNCYKTDDSRRSIIDSNRYEYISTNKISSLKSTLNGSIESSSSSIDKLNEDNKSIKSINSEASMTKQSRGGANRQLPVGVISSINNGILNDSLSASASSLDKKNGESGLSKKINKKEPSQNSIINGFKENEKISNEELSSKFKSNLHSRYPSSSPVSSVNLRNVSGTSGSALSSAAASLNRFNMTRRN